MCKFAAMLTVMVMILPGCHSGAGTIQRGDYTTVRSDPARDTPRARELNDRGLLRLQDGDLVQAEESFKQALTADVEYGPAHNNLGKVYFRQNDWYRAAWEFEYAAKLMHKRAEPRNNLGLVLERAGELDRAVEQFRLATDLDPNSSEYRGNLVRALVRRGDRTEEVEQLLQQVADQDTREDWQVWARQQLIRMRNS